MTQFNELGLAEPLLRAVAAEGYTHPTPIQAQVIPALLAGADILGTAQTGTGKTAAFVLPLLHYLSETKPRLTPKSCHALILVPTRELAAQVADSIRTYGKHVRHSTALIIGGARPYQQIKAMQPGVDIIIATPGRLQDHMRSGHIKLSATQKVVLDEADQMLDLGFLPAIRQILASLPHPRQTALLSATMPKQIVGLARDCLTKPQEIAVAQVSKPVELIDQKMIAVRSDEKNQKLTSILQGSDVERAIVFTRTKRGADRVTKYLEKAGLTAAALHGNKSQNQRERTLKGFRSGRVTILVATDIASRGIDVDGISHVINFELPNVPEAYVHRIGRTARAGKTGTAISLVDASEGDQLRDIERLLGHRLGDPGTRVAANENRAHPSKSRRPQRKRQGPKKAATGTRTAPKQGPRRNGRSSHTESDGLHRMLKGNGGQRQQRLAS